MQLLVFSNSLIKSFLISTLFLVSIMSLAQETLQDVVDNGSTTTTMITHSNSAGLRLIQNNVTTEFNALQIGQYGSHTSVIRLMPWSTTSGTGDWGNLLYYNFETEKWGATGDFVFQSGLILKNNQFVKGSRADGQTSNLIGLSSDATEQLITIGEYTSIPSELRIYTPTDPNQGVSVYGSEEIAFFRNDGDVGIGTHNPEAKLHVSDGNVKFEFDYDGAYKPSVVFEKESTAEVSQVFYRWTGVEDKYFGTRFLREGAAGFKLQMAQQATQGNHSFEDVITVLNSGEVGIGLSNPLAPFHFSTGNYGKKTQYGAALFEADNAQLDIISSSSYTWGSSINLIEGDNGWNTDIWSIARQTTNGDGDSSLRINFGNQNHHRNANKLIILPNGNVGIGTGDDDLHAKLSVNGDIRATEVKILSDISVPDYVFEDTYKLRSLRETQKFIQEHKHLPEVPSALEIGEDGLDLGAMEMKLLQKIEELTLYQIDLLDKLEQQSKRIADLEAIINKKN